MSSIYTGIAGNVVASASPTITIPSDGDPLNASSVTTPMQKLADYVAQLETSGSAILAFGATTTATDGTLCALLVGGPWGPFIAGGSTGNSGYSLVGQPPGNYRVSRLAVRNAISAGAQQTFTVYWNTVATSVSAVLSASDNSGFDIVNSVVINIGGSMNQLDVLARSTAGHGATGVTATLWLTPA